MYTKLITIKDNKTKTKQNSILIGRENVFLYIKNLISINFKYSNYFSFHSKSNRKQYEIVIK